MLPKDKVLDNRYRIVRLLGQGGFGAVYEAIDEKFGEPIALKEIHLLSKLSDEKKKSEVIKAFRREAKALAKAKHETIPFVRDYFSAEDRQFLAMELVEGDELFELLEKHQKPFSLKEVLDWANQLLDTLDYLHTLSPPIFHRDIKPQNLKLNSRGKIKLLDFGIAKVVESETQISLTQKTMMAATREYSPIEQLLHAIEPMSREYFLLKYKDQTEKILKQKTDARCDIYSLGATLYHLLTNRVPIDSAKRITEILDGKQDPLPIPHKINLSIPAEISNFLLKAMAIERKNRFKSAMEMHKTLEQIETSQKQQKDEAIKQIWAAEQENLKIEREKLESERQEHLKQVELEKQELQKSTTFNDFTNENTEEDNSFETYLAEEVTINNDGVTESETEILDYKAPLKTVTNNGKRFLALPIIGTLFLVVFGGGLYGIFSWNQSPDKSNANVETNIDKTPNSNANIKTNATKTPEITPSPKINSSNAKSISLGQILTALQSESSGLTLKEKNDFIIKQIKEKGIDFIFTSDIKTQLIKVGANNELVKIIQAKASKTNDSSSNNSDNASPEKTQTPVKSSKKPTVKVTPKPIIKDKTATKKKAIKKKQIKPTPKPDPNCVYTNSCK